MELIHNFELGLVKANVEFAKQEVYLFFAIHENVDVLEYALVLNNEHLVPHGRRYGVQEQL